MSTGSKIQKIFSTPDVKHGLSLFSANEINAVERLITVQDGNYYINCQIKDKLKVAKPEEAVRQLWIYRLLTEYGYPKERIDIEKVVYFGSRVEPGAADIVVYHEDLRHYYILFEVKRPSRTAGLEQLKSYCNAEGTPIGVWSNGNEIIRLHREEPNLFIEIPRIPKISETLRDILTERWTLRWLEEHDELKQGKTTLKKILLDLEELVLGNAGVKAFDEIFKLIYAKLYDEWKGINDPNYQLEFFVGDRSPEQVKRAITNLLDGAKRTWAGVFEPTDRIELMDTHLKICVSFLEKIKLFNSNLRIIDEAFEYLIPEVSKKKEGQFFTPRPVEDMVVKMMNPKSHEFLIDPACGSAGFLLHSVMWIAGGVITGKELSTPAKNFAQNNIYGIDFAKEAVKIAKAINLIVGDGKSHIYGGGPHGNSLNPLTWNDEVKAGLRPRLLRFPEDLENDRDNQNRFLYFDFDILMTNPPFAGTVKERDILRLYQLADKNGRLVKQIGRHILFLNRSLQFIRPGGRMAIVLPQGLLNNTNTEYIRRFIIDEARILAVVGLHGNTFKPHTGTKTSVLFIQKYTEEAKQKIQEIKLRYEEGWDDFIGELKEKYQNVNWDKSVDEEELPEELKSFIETYFETREELEEIEGSEIEDNKEEIEDTEEIKRKKPLKVLVEELQEVQTLLEEKQEELNSDISNEKRTELKKEIRTLNTKVKKLDKEISQRTLGGQIHSVLNQEKITEQFREFWLDGKVMKEMDYPIFFAINQKPLKDNKGEYRYIKSPNGEFVLDEYGHPKIGHDLDEIAEAFVKFAKEQGVDFWR
ncbi:MAG: N-6 DNA methylase [Methanocellales archaeon]|nr:N-6 DNA methylase [Methanocellales archaeon]MDD3292111.1 N-6 DNA methylase [Methanocellales archaeon]MDD5235348.1 N-6 DNA methylase [Methanocellales archaeon]MDD5485704.1 N-6 DNA methylase [Methanocellales archaeon]